MGISAALFGEEAFAGDALAAGAGDALAGGLGFDAGALGAAPLAETAVPLAGGVGADAAFSVPVATSALDAGALAGGAAATDLGGFGAAADLAGAGQTGVDFGGALGSGDALGAGGPASSSFNPLAPGAGPPPMAGPPGGPANVGDVLQPGFQDPLDVSSGVGGGEPDLTASSDSSAVGGGGGPSNAASSNLKGGLMGGAAPDATPVSTTQAPSANTFGSLSSNAPASTAPTASAAAPAAKAASGGFDWKTAGMLGLGAAPLAYTMLKGEASMPPQAAQLASTNAGLQNFSNQYLGMVQNNQLTPAQNANITQQRQALENQWRQILFNQGSQNPQQDSRWPQIEAQIDQQMQASTQAMMQTNLQAALSGAGQASTNLTNLANMQIQQDTAFSNAISNAAKAAGTVGALAAGSGKLGL